MSCTPLTTLCVAVLTMAVAIERVLEIVWTVMHTAVDRKQMTCTNNTNCTLALQQMKTILSVPFAIGVGVVMAIITDVDFCLLPDKRHSQCLVGTIAGFLSPFAHELLQLVLQTQKLLSNTAGQTVQASQTAATAAKATAVAATAATAAAPSNSLQEEEEELYQPIRSRPSS